MVENVTDYGAVGDGSTDDTQAIIDAANAAGANGTVFFPPGTYLIGSNSNNPLTYPGDGSWDNITWRGESYDRSTIKMAGGHGSAYYTGWRFGNGTVTDGRWEQLTIDGNKANNGHDNSAAVYSDANDAGTFEFVDCLIHDWRGNALNWDDGTSDMVIKRCEFRDQGQSSGAGGTHDINCNMADASTVDVEYSSFIGTAGESFDIGDDSTGDYMTVNVDWCYFEGMRGAFKLDPENDVTTINNCKFVAGSYTTLCAVKANNSNYNCGSVVMNDCRVEGGSWPGIGVNAADFDNYELYNVSVQDVDNGDNAGQGIDARDAAVTCGTISIHDVGSNNDGDALLFENCTGSIDEVIYGGTSAPSNWATDGVSITTTTSGASLSPNVASATDTGPTASDTVSVVDYGAVGDGVADDTQEIRDAADTAEVGSTVYFPAGTYLVGSNSDFPLDYPMDGSWDNLTWEGEAWDTTKLLMDSGHSNWHMMFRAQSGGGYQIPDVTFKQLDLDMNSQNNTNAPGSGLFRIYDGQGTLKMRDCIVRNTLGFGIQFNDAMGGDVAYCEFNTIGTADRQELVGHSLNPNPDSAQTYDVSNCYFVDGNGQAVDVGTDDTGNDYVTLNFDSNYRERGYGGIKITAENAQTNVRNCQFYGDAGFSLQIIKSNSPTGYECGDVLIDNVYIETDDGSGIDLAADGGHTQVEIYQTALYDVSNSGFRDFAGTEGKGVTIYNSDINADHFSVHDVNGGVGAAVFFNSSCTGSVDTVSHDTTAELGETHSVTVGTNDAGGAQLSPNVVSKSDTGPRVSNTASLAASATGQGTAVAHLDGANISSGRSEVHYFNDQSWAEWNGGGTDWTFTTGAAEGTHAAQHITSNFQKIGSHPDTERLPNYPDAGSTIAFLAYPDDLTGSTYVGGWADSNSSVDNLHVRIRWGQDTVALREEVAGVESSIVQFDTVGLTADTWYYCEVRHYNGSFYNGTADTASIGFWEFDTLSSPKGTLVAGDDHSTTYAVDAVHGNAGHNGVLLWSDSNSTDRVDWFNIESGNVISNESLLSAAASGSGTATANLLTEPADAVLSASASGTGAASAGLEKTFPITTSKSGEAKTGMFKTGEGTATSELSASGVGTGTASAIISISGSYEASGSGTGTGSGSLLRERIPSASATFTGTASADILTERTLLGIGGGWGIAWSNLELGGLRNLSVDASGTGTAESDLLTVRKISGSGAGILSASAPIATHRSLKAIPAGVGTSDAKLRTFAAPTEPGDGIEITIVWPDGVSRTLNVEKPDRD